jgi:hypothetical protein
MKTQITILTLLFAGTAMACNGNDNCLLRDEGGFIQRFDRNGDGKVSQDEFKGPDEHFTHLDRNSDGYITKDEAPQGPPPGQGQNGRGGESERGGGFVKRLDKDNDGKVSKEEFDGPAGHFSHFDRNGDGYITEDEAPKGPPPGREGKQSR